MAEGQLDPTHFIGRLFRHVLAGGFVYLMIVNGFAWMYLVIQSFSRIGSAISGLPALSPASVLKAGLAMTQMLINSPSTTGLLNNLELAFVSGFLALVVGAAFLIVAVELMLTLVKAYLTTSLGVILLGFEAIASRHRPPKVTSRTSLELAPSRVEPFDLMLDFSAKTTFIP